MPTYERHTTSGVVTNLTSASTAGEFQSRRVICVKPTFMSPASAFNLEALVKEWWIKGRALIRAQKEPVRASGAQADIARQAGTSPGEWVRVGCLLSEVDASTVGHRG